MDRVLGEINKLSLDRLPDDWVDSVFYFEFTGFEDIPSDYEAVLDSIEIQNVFASLLKYLNRAEDSDENTWASLAPIVPIRNLLAVVGHYIKYGTDHVTTREHQENALLAARVYFRLLMIPGAQAYHIYHSQLFAHSISCLGFPKLMCEKKHDYLSNEQLSTEVRFVLKKLSHYVVDLKAIVLQLKLTPADINYEEILANLIDVTGGAITQSLNVDRILLANISTLIYEVINSMICNYGDHPDATPIDTLFKCLVPKLVAASLDTRITNNFVKASYVTYAGVILTKYSSVALDPYIKMLQHICYDVESLVSCSAYFNTVIHKDRADQRNARADLVVGLMSLLPGAQHREFLEWVITLSTVAKLVHRHLALEILARLLNNESEINEQRVTLRNNVDRQNAASNALPNAIPEPTNEDEEPRVSEISPDMDESEDSIEVGFLRQEPHTVPYQRILEAVSERASDAGSAVRTRALAVLADCVAKRRARTRSGDDAGPDLSAAAAAAAARFMLDDRAAVRRSAVALALRLLRAPAPSPSFADLKILVGLCQDAFVTVRTAAIAAVGELALTRPSDATIDAFLIGPFNYLTDVEPKIVAQVKSFLEQILSKRLVKYSDDNDDVFPWIFLQGIIRSNMRKNLQHACSVLASTEQFISVRLVDMLSSHLGAKDERRDLQCLLLLSSVARYVDYSDIGFVLEYFYKIAPLHNTGPPPVIADLRIMELVLYVLCSWAKFAKPPDRTRLRDHLVQRLTSSIDDECRILSLMLAKQLDPKNLIWATELMQLSEKTALESGSVKEALRATDLSLVSTRPPSPKIMLLFLSAIKNPPPYWSDIIAGECVAGVARLALRSRAAAAVAAPALADVLLRADAPLQPRVNALLALADCSHRYANIVEPLLGSVCSCLQPSTPAALRHVTVRSLTELLLSEFIRLRKPLYFDYCALIADSDKQVREPVEFYVSTGLKPDIICHNLVDCVLHYSDSTKSDLRDFDSRQLIYDLMLQRLSVMQKLSVQCRLAKEILVHAADLVDNAEEVPHSLNLAMLDTIQLLTGPRMKLPRKDQQTGDLLNMEDIQERVTTNLISTRMKRTVAEVMVPAVMRLYARLSAGGGQLAAYLVMLMQGLEVDYAEEIEELIENDPDLVTRIAAFRENHSVEATAGNMRNLVTTSGPPEPETPKPQRKHERASRRGTIKTRTLEI